jgi:hypothetical protein
MDSGFQLGRASEMATVHSEMLTEMVSELELEMGSEMPLESKSIDWAPLFQGNPYCLTGSSSLVFTVLFEMDVIAILEE